jgi:hypothetical protein
VGEGRNLNRIRTAEFFSGAEARVGDTLCAPPCARESANSRHGRWAVGQAAAMGRKGNWRRWGEEIK